MNLEEFDTEVKKLQQRMKEAEKRNQKLSAISIVLSILLIVCSEVFRFVCKTADNNFPKIILGIMILVIASANLKCIAKMR